MPGRSCSPLTATVRVARPSGSCRKSSANSDANSHLPRIEKTNSGHLRLVLPNGKVVIAASTPGCRHALENLKGDVRRNMKVLPIRLGTPGRCRIARHATLIKREPAHEPACTFDNGIAAGNKRRRRTELRYRFRSATGSTSPNVKSRDPASPSVRTALTFTLPGSPETMPDHRFAGRYRGHAVPVKEAMLAAR